MTSLRYLDAVQELVLNVTWILDHVPDNLSIDFILLHSLKDWTFLNFDLNWPNIIAFWSMQTEFSHMNVNFARNMENYDLLKGHLAL